MKVYVARHGQTEWNVLNKVCGRTDIGLTQEGFQQAKELSNHIATYKIQIIISSPLKRAIQTAQVVSQENNIPYLIDKRLIEQDYGIFEGVDRKNTDFLENKKQFAFRYPYGESMMQVAYRTYGLLEEIKNIYKGKNVLLVCHGGVARVIHTYFRDIRNEDFFLFSLENCHCLEYEFKE